MRLKIPKFLATIDPPDALMVAGCLLLIAGVGYQWGPGFALMTAGVICVLLAWIATNQPPTPPTKAA